MDRYNDPEARFDRGFERIDIGLDFDPIQIPDLTGASGVSFTGQVTLSTFTADQNNLTLPDGLSFRMGTNGVARTITGFANPRPGRIAYLHNRFGGANILIANQNAGSTAEYRTITGTGASITVQPDRSAAILYDGEDKRWLLLFFT